MRDINPSDIDTMVSIKGMVTRTSGIIPEMIGAVFSCEVSIPKNSHVSDIVHYIS